MVDRLITASTSLRITKHPSCNLFSFWARPIFETDEDTQWQVLAHAWWTLFRWGVIKVTQPLLLSQTSDSNPKAVQDW